MKRLAPLAALLVLAACAEQAVQTDTTERRERVEPTTGSNISKRNRDNGVTTYDRESVERAQSGSYGGIPRVPGN